MLPGESTSTPRELKLNFDQSLATEFHLTNEDVVWQRVQRRNLGVTRCLLPGLVYPVLGSRSFQT